MAIQFKNGTSESEVKSILQDYNMTRNYRITFDTNHYPEYYIMVDKDKIKDIKEVENKITWNASTIIRGNYYIMKVPEKAIHYKSFLEALDKHDIQLERFVWCDIRFLYSDGPLTYWIPKEDAIRVKNELEKNENIFTVQFDYLYPPCAPITEEPAGKLV